MGTIHDKKAVWERYQQAITDDRFSFSESLKKQADRGDVEIQAFIAELYDKLKEAQCPTEK